MRVTVRSSEFLAGARSRRRRAPAPPRISGLAEVFADGDEYSELASDSRTRAQAGMFYWAADYPAPSNFLAAPAELRRLPARSVDNLNLAEFCGPSHRRSHAPRGPRTDVESSARESSMGRSRPGDRRCRSVAPALQPPLVELLSQRVGGHRYSPIYGTLIDQLWVR